MKKIKAVGGGGGVAATAPTDLLVCFPARARQHLALMPKPICSPSRTTMDKAVAARRRQLQLPAARSGGGRGGSPLFRGSSKAKQTVEQGDEPQSPKVTCAGQIKVVRPKKARPAVLEKKPGNNKCGAAGGGSGRRWITVVEEIERLQEQRKKARSWLEAVGIRRDAPALPFLGGVLRSLRHKVRCFGSLHAAVDSSSSSTDDSGGGGYADERVRGESAAPGGSAAASVFSKWLMVLEGSQETHQLDQEEKRPSREVDVEDFNAPSVPPPNALLLMRCRSAPAKGLASKGAGEPPAGEEAAQEKGSMEAAAGQDRGDLAFMSTAPDFLKLSVDIAKETWVVGGADPLARSRSWKR